MYACLIDIFYVHFKKLLSGLQKSQLLLCLYNFNKLFAISNHN